MEKQTSTRLQLVLAGILLVVVWQLPFGRQLLYPLSLLATFAHEMGHGVAAMVLGHDFNRLSLHSDGSGVAQWAGSPGRLGLALVAAGGLVGPSVAGSMLLVLSRSARWNRWVLLAMSALMLISALIWVRSAFGLVFVLGWGTAFGLCGRFLPPRAATWAVHTVALTLCLSIFKDIDYMFSSHAVVGGQTMLSDAATMAEALWLPHWFWGAAVAGFSTLTMIFGIVLATKSENSGNAITRGRGSNGLP